MAHDTGLPRMTRRSPACRIEVKWLIDKADLRRMLRAARSLDLAAIARAYRDLANGMEPT